VQHKYKNTVTPSSGTWSGNTANIFGGICCQVYAKAATATTTFDLKIQDSAGYPVRKFTAAVGELNDLGKWSAQGVHTITIENASADEAFDLLMVIEEF